MSGRLLVGNLDGEGELAQAFAPRRRPRLSRAALATASALATLLRAFVEEGDHLWTPAPVDPERLPEVPGLPRPELVSGPLEDLPPATEVLAWMETPAVPAGCREGRIPPRSPLHKRLWHLPRSTPEAVARVADRGFALELVRELGLALPGARTLTSRCELEAHLAAGGAAASPTGGWVLKAPLSAAGRDRCLHPRAEEGVPPAAWRRVERLFEVHGPLLFEPWMERTEDFGVAALLMPEGFEVVGFHRLLVDRRGGFAGIELDAAFAGFHAALAAFSEQEQALWRRAVGESAAALDREGYRGPFGLDGWRHRPRWGSLALQPLGEINPRLTFGLIARALADRVGEALGWAPEARIRLAVDRAAPVAEAVPLLAPGEDGSPGAWLTWV